MDRYKRIVAVCYYGNQNLNKLWSEMVGLLQQIFKRVCNMNYARDNKLGIWEGKFIKPSEWRKIINNLKNQIIGDGLFILAVIEHIF